MRSSVPGVARPSVAASFSEGAKTAVGGAMLALRSFMFERVSFVPERVLVALPSDVLVVKPKRFVTRVSRTRRGVKYTVSSEVPMPY